MPTQLRITPLSLAAAIVCVATPVVLAPLPASAAPSKPSWRAVQSMPESRSDAIALRLGDGRVLLAGGVLGASSAATATAETYSPVTNTWTPVPDMSVERDQGTGVTLQDGRALVLGGFCFAGHSNCLTGNSGVADIFDPATNSWTSTAAVIADGVWQGTLTLLQDGRVLLAGGNTCDVHGICTHLATAYLFDPSTGSWTQTGSMSQARALAASFLLPDGRVLVVGGVCDSDLAPCDTNPTGTAEIFNPATGTWTPAANPLATPGLPTLIDSGDHGTPLLLGGGNGNTVQRYNEATDSWSLAAPTPCDYGSQSFNETDAAQFGSNSTMVIGITTCQGATPNIAMLYRPLFGWSPTMTVNNHPYGDAIVTLADGRVLVAGGGNGDGADPPAAKTAEVFG